MGIYQKRDLQKAILKGYVEGLMRREGLTQAQVAKCFGKEQSWFSRKLNSGKFTVNELMLLFYYLKADVDGVGNALTIRRNTNE